MVSFILCSILFCLQETFKIDKDGQECSLQFEPLSHRTEKEANGHADVMCNGGSSESPDHGVTEMCQRVLCNVLTSEKFSSLCKALLENFQGMKPESVLDFTVMNSRMKEQAYEQSPTLFLSDIQQVNLSSLFLIQQFVDSYMIQLKIVDDRISDLP